MKLDKKQAIARRNQELGGAVLGDRIEPQP